MQPQPEGSDAGSRPSTSQPAQEQPCASAGAAVADCCYGLSAAAMRQARREGKRIRVHNSDSMAPLWSDVFDVTSDVDRSWCPLEEPLSAVAASTRPNDVPASPSEALRTAYAARTLQQRLHFAKAALWVGGQGTTDAHLLLSDCQPGQTVDRGWRSPPAAQAALVARYEYLAAAEKAAVAAAKREAAEQPQLPQQLGKGAACGPALRAAVRAVLALLRCYRQSASACDHTVVWDHVQWFKLVDPGDQVARVLVTLEGLWASTKVLPAGVTVPNIGQLAYKGMEAMMVLDYCKREMDDAASFGSMLMAVVYSVYFLAYALEGPNSTLVRRALVAVRKLDPHKWVPLLLTGQAVADPTVGPSYLLGSKQEAMACCAMVGEDWFTCASTNGPGGKPQRPALARLLGVEEQQLPQLPHTQLPSMSVPAPGMTVQTVARSAVLNFNKRRGFDGVEWMLAMDAASDVMVKGGPYGRVDSNMDALWALCIMMLGAGSVTQNLPPLATHWQHWEQCAAAKRVVGGTEQEFTAVSATAVLCAYALQMHHIATMVLDALQRILPASGQQRRDIDMLTQTVEALQPCRLRWLWQAGKPDLALQILNRWMHMGPGAAVNPTSKWLPGAAEHIRSFLAEETRASAAGKH